MNKQELITAAAAKAELTKKDCEKALKAITEAIVAEVALFPSPFTSAS